MLTIVQGQQFTSQYRPLATKKDFVITSNTFMGIRPSSNGAIYMEYPHDIKLLTNKFTECKSYASGASIGISYAERGEASYNCFLKNTNGKSENRWLGIGLFFFLSKGDYVANGNSFASCPDENGFGCGVAAFRGYDWTYYYTVSMRDNNFTNNRPDEGDAVYIRDFDTALISCNTYINNSLNSLVEIKEGNSMQFDDSNIVGNAQMKENSDAMIIVEDCKVNAARMVCISNIFNKVVSDLAVTLTNCKFYDCKFNVPVTTVAVKPYTNTLSNAPFDLCLYGQ